MKTRFLILGILALAACSLPHTAPAQSATLQVATGTDGTTPIVQTPVVITAGQTLTVNGAGLPIALTLPTAPPLSKSGVSTGALALSRTVTFTTAMTDALYSVTLTPASGVVALQISYSNKSKTGFTINFSASTAQEISWRVEEPNNG